MSKLVSWILVSTTNDIEHWAASFLPHGNTHKFHIVSMRFSHQSYRASITRVFSQVIEKFLALSVTSGIRMEQEDFPDLRHITI